MPTSDVFAIASELPSVTDTAYLAMLSGNQNAVAALARMLKRQEATRLQPVAQPQ